MNYKEKYRIRELDHIHDIWNLEKRTFFIFWKFFGCGSKEQVSIACLELNNPIQYQEFLNKVDIKTKLQEKESSIQFIKSFIPMALKEMQQNPVNDCRIPITCGGLEKARELVKKYGENIPEDVLDDII